MDNYCEITCEIRHETDRAILIFDGAQEVWIAKSQIREPAELPPIGETFDLSIPEWLAKEKGLI